MLTSDLALKFDPDYKKVCQKFLENPLSFDEATSTISPKAFASLIALAFTSGKSKTSSISRNR